MRERRQRAEATDGSQSQRHLWLRNRFVSGLLWVGLGTLASCSDALLEAQTRKTVGVDNRLALTGRVCTAPLQPNGFPVKVVLIVDKSGSMCISDPPGAQEMGGFCQQLATAGVIPPGVTEPARVRALRSLMTQFSAQPNVQVAIVPFESNVKDPYPAEGFVPASSVPASRVTQLQSQLGKGTDYQGALAEAYARIASDIQKTEMTNPQQLPRTRYVVVFLTDGTPFPRCSANDALAVYADPDHPELTWPDSFNAEDFCNIIDPSPTADTINGFVVGTDRNQNYQLFSYVDQLMELRNQHNIGDIRMHTVLLFNEAAVRACGPICQDVYGRYPGTATADYPAAAKKIASYVLRSFAERGNGVYQEFVNSDIGSLGLGALDYSSLASRNVMKTFVVQALSSVPDTDERTVDSDGDGVRDTEDNSFTMKTNPYTIDSDGDCFDDGFEALHRDEGFKADVKDSRGCDPTSPLSLGCACRDTDGDGLSQYAEAYLKTNPTIFDTDGDGIPDGLEARYGLNARVHQGTALDTDGDGTSDIVEFRADSNPIRQDRQYFDKNGYQYEVTPQLLANGSTCYDVKVTNLSLVTPPNRAGVQQGFNLFKMYFGEVPESGVATDYGVWKASCAWAQYDPPQIREPAGPDLTFADNNFRPPNQLNDASQYQTRCVGRAP